jgi:hypothetical protein
MAGYDPLPVIPDDCKCSGGFPPCPTGGGYMGTWVPGWMVEQVRQGQPLVVDSRTKPCLDVMVKYTNVLRSGELLYRGLPENFVALSKEWDDVSRRSALLARMAQSTPEQLEAYYSSHMDEHWNIRLWLARFKAYVDTVERISLHNSIPEKDTATTLDLFYAKF